MAGTPILVVDDAPVNRKLIRLLLTHDGYEVRTAERAEDALKMLANYRPELILADIQLPGMNGLEMTRKVKEDPRTSTIRVVALTACAMKEDRERAMRAGCEDYIAKPIDTSTLSARIRELLARPAAVPAAPAAPVEAPPSEAPLGFSGPEFESLRRRFLNEGTERSRQLLDSLNSSFDALRAGRQLHEWTGSAGLLGHPEISSLSRNAEELLREEPVKIARLREVLTDLFFTFTDLRDSKVAPLPDYVVQATTGKSFALIGFTTERADAMCALLERVKARPRLFDATDDPNSEAIRDCDLLVFHVRPETLASSWLKPGVSHQAVKNLVFTGEQRDLIALAPDVRSQAVDFLMDREEPEEVLMRLAFAVSRGSVTVSTPPRAAVAAASVSGEVPTPAKPAITRPSIVLADDDGIVLTLVKSTLQNYGMVCRSADNGLDALNLIRREQPHVAVLDVNMPGMDGFEVLAAVRAENLPSRVILLTSLQHENEILRAFKMGADDYLTKPFNPFELVARLKRLLR
jgi:two-component system, cell cycle response regulator DivK